MNVDYKLIGLRIKEVRKQRNMTQEKLAEMLDVSIGYVSQVERGITKISLDLLAAISGALQQDVAFFVGGAGVPTAQYMVRDITDDFSALTPKNKRLVADFIKLLLQSQ